MVVNEVFNSVKKTVAKELKQFTSEEVCPSVGLHVQADLNLEKGGGKCMLTLEAFKRHTLNVKHSDSMSYKISPMLMTLSSQHCPFKPYIRRMQRSVIQVSVWSTFLFHTSLQALS